MPAVTGNHDLYFQNLMDEIRHRLTALEMQQNFGIRDASGLIRAQGGKLPNGDYGFAVTDPSGTTREVNPVYASNVGAYESTSSGTPTDLATIGPQLTVNIGQSKSALVIVGADISVPAGGAGKATINGGDPSAMFQSASAGHATVSSATILFFVSSGLNTIKLQYELLAGAGPVTFGARWMIVEPL